MRDYLVNLREQRNEAQQDVAKALGVSRQYYSMIENGVRQKKMDVPLMLALAAHFNISAADMADYEQQQMDSGHA